MDDSKPKKIKSFAEFIKKPKIKKDQDVSDYPDLFINADNIALGYVSDVYKKPISID